MSYVGTTDFNLEVAKGNVPGHMLTAIAAMQADVGTSFQDVWSGGGNIVYPTIAETLEVVSDNAADTSAGTGAQEITVFTLALDGSSQTPVVASMNGTTPVVLTGTHFRTNNLIVSASGSGGANVGKITLRVSSGGATRAVIAPDSIASFSAIYTVPLGYNFIWNQSSVFAPKGEDVRLRSRFQFGGVGQFLQGADSTNYQNIMVYKFLVPLRLPEKSELRIQAKSTNVGIFTSTILEGYLIDNSLVNGAGSQWI